MASESLTDGTPTNGSNAWVDSLVWGGKWTDADGGTVTITYARASGLDPHGVILGGYEWESVEVTALNSALAAWEAVANIDFVPTTSNAADIWYWVTDSFDMGSDLGSHEVPGYSSGEPLYGLFNIEGLGWTPSGLAKGGLGYVTLIHEIGHGLGLAHPHDGGFAFDATVFPGVTPGDGFDDYGNFDLNQGIWTTMSYNDGWPTGFPDFFSENYGWQGTPMALDIAAVQAIYGANLNYNVGNNSYLLPTANGPGTYWSCIWDAGGTDIISAAGSSLSCVINLNAAPLTGQNAGGFVSWADGIVGGFTIANGVVIENATGGSGHDLITGNGTRNLLRGLAGNDAITGGKGNDSLEGGSGNDNLVGGGGNDRFDWEADSRSGTDTMAGGAGNDVYVLDSAADVVHEVSGGGTDLIWTGFSYALSNLPHVERLFLFGSAAADATGNAANNALGGNDASNVIKGLAGADNLEGGAGNDVLWGGSGRDTLAGGTGADRFVFNSTPSTTTNNDTILDFASGQDKIQLDDDVFTAFAQSSGTRGLTSAQFWSGASAHDTSDRVIYDQSTGALLYDSDGTGAAVAVQFALLSTQPGIVFSDFQVVA